MTSFRNRRVGGSRRRFVRRRGKSLYEMQQGSFTRQSIIIPGGSNANNPSSDLFLMYHPRLEWSDQAEPDTANNRVALPIAKGCVIKGGVHKLAISFVPLISAEPTATAVGFVTIHAAIVRVPTQPSDLGVSGSFPQLFSPDVDIPAPLGVSSLAEHFRIIWRGLYHLSVIDGSVVLVNAPFLTSSTLGLLGGDSSEFVRTKSAVSLSMDQGLYLLVQCASPFATGTIELGLDFWYAFGIKPMTRGATYK